MIAEAPPAAYVNACIDLNAHIAGCWSACRGGRGWTLCEIGDQIVVRMMDALGFGLDDAALDRQLRVLEEWGA